MADESDHGGIGDKPKKKFVFGFTEDLKKLREARELELRKQWDPNYRARPDPKPGGRPAYDDESRLKAMARLIASGEVRGHRVVRTAARMAAGMDPDPDPNATAERIRKKYAPRRDELESDAARNLTVETARKALRQEAAARRSVGALPGFLTTTSAVEEMSATVHANAERERLQEQVRIRSEVDPQFARHIRQSGIRPGFVSLQCLRDVVDSFSPKRRLRR